MWPHSHFNGYLRGLCSSHATSFIFSNSSVNRNSSIYSNSSVYSNSSTNNNSSFSSNSSFNSNSSVFSNSSFNSNSPFNNNSSFNSNSSVSNNSTFFLLASKLFQKQHSIHDAQPLHHHWCSCEHGTYWCLQFLWDIWPWGSDKCGTDSNSSQKQGGEKTCLFTAEAKV